MKRKFKGFTLVELIIVIAIFSILMTAIIQCFRPIRETYVDSTLYESQRTAQNGVVKYISESTRYATDLGVYTKGKSASYKYGGGSASDILGAVNSFAEAYFDEHDISDGTQQAWARQYIWKNAEVIIIDNSTSYVYGGEEYYGRVVRRKLDDKAAMDSSKRSVTSSDEIMNPDGSSANGWCRLALGSAYYGKSDCSILVTPDTGLDGDGNVASRGLKINVASKAKYGIRQTHKGEDPYDRDNGGIGSSKVVSVSGLVVCQNLTPPAELSSRVKRTFDTKCFDAVTSAQKGSKTYIVFLNDKVPDDALKPY